MAPLKRIINSVVRYSDILLVILDARRVRSSISRFLESMIKTKRKRFIYVINKCDLLSSEELAKIRLPNSVKISATKRTGIPDLMKKMEWMARGRDVVVGVVGIPNTGKSTVINALKGRKSAPTSAVSGFTKGIQKLRISSNIMVIDTPGVMPYSRKEDDLILIGAVNPESIEDPEMAAAKLIDKLNGRIERYFGVSRQDDSLITLEKIALKKKLMKKGGEADTKRMAIDIIRMCQRGKINTGISKSEDDVSQNF